MIPSVEKRIALLQGTEEALLFPSGMAAIACTILAHVKAGDRIILFKECYRRTRQLIMDLASFGVAHTMLEAWDMDGLQSAAAGGRAFVFSESPTNPHLRCMDLERFADAAGPRAVTCIDSTIASPWNCRSASYGIGLVVESATKYLAGHMDVLAGTVAGSHELVVRIRTLRDIMGYRCHAHAAELVGLGLDTLSLRMEQMNENGLAVAQALENHPMIERVYYPGLASHPDHETACRQMKGFGGLVSFTVHGGRKAASRVVDACKLAIIATSFGGPCTLIEQPPIMSHYDLNDDELAAIGIESGLIRLAVGIEEGRDIVADLMQALDSASL